MIGRLLRSSTASRLAACAISGLTLVCLGAPSAAAKSGLSVTAVPAAAGSGHRAGVEVSGFGGDDAAGRQRLCLQRSVAGSWHTLACGRVQLGTGGRVQVLVVRASADDRFRAQLQKVGSDRRTVPDLTSSAVRVHRQTNSRSVVSLSRRDKGIAVASVVRLK